MLTEEFIRAGDPGGVSLERVASDSNNKTVMFS